MKAEQLFEQYSSVIFEDKKDKEIDLFNWQNMVDFAELYAEKMLNKASNEIGFLVYWSNHVHDKRTIEEAQKIINRLKIDNELI